MENSNGGDMSPLVNKESILTKEVEKKEVEPFTTDEKKILIKKIFGEKEKQDDVVIKDVWGKEVGRYKAPMTFIKKEEMLPEHKETGKGTLLESITGEKILLEDEFLSKEEEEWIKQFSGITIPNEKEYNGYRHHHYKLADKISAMCERIKELELFQKMIRSRYPDAYWDRVERYIKRMEYQEEKIRQERRKLEVLKKERVKVHYGR